MKKKIFLKSFLLTILFFQNSNSQVSQNFRVFPDNDILQVETPLIVSPQNPQIFAGASITDEVAGGHSLGFFISTNGGLNWTGTNDVRPGETNAGGNPSIGINSSGKIVLSYLYQKIDSKYGLKVTTSTNNGSNWTTSVSVPGVDNGDKDVLVIDNSPFSSYKGRMYIFYFELYPISRIYFSKSTDDGATWSTAASINTFDDASTPCAAIGKNGEIYVGTNFRTMLKSTDGGENWTLVGLPATYTSLQLETFTDGTLITGAPYIACDQKNGNVYLTKWGRYQPLSTDNHDILVFKSTNGGVNWTQTKANNDNTGDKHQFFPQICVDKYGGVNIIYYDTRNTSTNDSCQIYLSRSMDGAQTFNDYLISDHKFYLKKVENTGHTVLFGYSGFIGSYIGLASNSDKLQGLWYDPSSNDNYQAWTASFELPVVTVVIIPEGFLNTTTNKLNSKDTIRAYFRNSGSPYAIADSAIGVLDSVTFEVKFIFPSLTTGNYYLNIKHRNSIETWSKNTISYEEDAPLTYNFTTASNKAYGDNLVLKGGKYCMYSGDVNQNGSVDLTDVVLVNDAMNNFVTGYVPEDITGDNEVDLTDVLLASANSTNFVMVVKP